MVGTLPAATTASAAHQHTPTPWYRLLNLRKLHMYRAKLSHGLAILTQEPNCNEHLSLSLFKLGRARLDSDPNWYASPEASRSAASRLLCSWKTYSHHTQSPSPVLVANSNARQQHSQRWPSWEQSTVLAAPTARARCDPRQGLRNTWPGEREVSFCIGSTNRGSGATILSHLCRFIWLVIVGGVVACGSNLRLSL